MQVAILGGGVAGLCCGIALLKKGCNVAIYEMRNGLSTIGAGAVIWPKAVNILDKLGLLDEVQELGGAPTSMYRLSSSGEELGILDIELLNKQAGQNSISITRYDLVSTLTRHFINKGGLINYDSGACEIIRSKKSAQATVILRSGLAISPDMIIGAEGRMNSPSRHYVLGHNLPVFQYFLNWVGVATVPHAVIDKNTILDFWGIGSRFGIVPISENTVYWAGGIACEKEGPKNPELYKKELKDIFSQWSDAVSHVIEGSSMNLINKIYLYDHDPQTNWYRDNVILVGDSAHASLPTSGQGVSMAIEDAWALAKLVEPSTCKLERTFQAFTGERQHKTREVITTGRRLARQIFNTDPEYCVERNNNSKKTDFRLMALSMVKE